MDSQEPGHSPKPGVGLRCFPNLVGRIGSSFENKSPGTGGGGQLARGLDEPQRTCCANGRAVFRRQSFSDDLHDDCSIPRSRQRSTNRSAGWERRESEQKRLTTNLHYQRRANVPGRMALWAGGFEGGTGGDGCAFRDRPMGSAGKPVCRDSRAAGPSGDDGCHLPHPFSPCDFPILAERNCWPFQINFHEWLNLSSSRRFPRPLASLFSGRKVSAPSCRPVLPCQA